jgi:iron complex outermembrane receptor protein
MKSSPQRRAHPAPARTELRLSPVAAAVTTVLFGALPVQAQQAPSAPGGTAGAQTITVTGIRRSIESSIALKRESDQIVEAITAEDIGKLPDISIAESLSRLPGLAAQRVDGRAQVIAIRGMSPDFAGTLLNGREQTTTGVNRGVEFDQYPAELLNAALVYKTPDATLLGQGISGTVDLRAVRPLSVGERKVALNARAEHNSQGALNGSYGGTGANGGRFSASYIDQFADRTVGIALGAAHLDAPGQELHYKAWGFQDDSNCLSHQADWGCSPVKGLPAGASYLNGFEIEAVSRRDQRDGLMGVLEYKPDQHLHSIVDLYYSTFKQTEVMRGLMGSVGDGWSGVNSGSTFSNVATTPIGGVSLVTSATTAGGPPLVVRNDYNTRDDKLTSVGWNTEARIGGFKAIADLSYSNARRDEMLFETYAGAPAGSMAFSIPTGAGFPSFTSSTNFADPTQVALRDQAGWGHVGRQQYSKLDDTLKAVNLHAKKDLEGPISRIDAGLNYSQRDKTRSFLVNFAALKTGGSQLLAAGQAATPVSLGFAGVPGVLSYDVNQIAGQYYTMTQNMSGGPTGDYSRDYGVHERISTAYVKADINTELGKVPVTGNFGAQLIHTEQSSDAYAFSPGGATLGTISPGTSYNDVLPSLNLVGDIGGNRKLRFGLARTLARPRIDDMNAASSASVADTGATKGFWSGSGGNPRLLPWRANGVDLSLEQYLGRRSYVAGALFYKQLVSYIYQQTIAYDFTGYVNGNPNPTPVVSSIGQFSTNANGQGGNMRGAEFSAALDGGLVAASLEGFGALLTASFTSSSIQVNGPNGATPLWTTLPGLSKTVAGLTLYYEANGFSIRVSDRYRSDYRGEYVSLFGATSVYRTPAQNQVDFQTSYEFQQGPAKGLSLLFQIVNATNAADRTLQDGSGFGGVKAPQENNQFGRGYLFGVNYKL